MEFQTTLDFYHTHVLKTVIYTIGHIMIAMLCIVAITGSSIGFASIDAIIEPLINAIWFYILEKSWKGKSTTLKTLLYTAGHITIAVLCTLIITGSELQYALIDAIVEPCVNGIWYLVLEKLWIPKESLQER